MSVDNCLIIGGSHAGATLAASLRQEGWSGKIALISAEESLPYHRPPLSKSALNGEKEGSEILIRPADFYKKADIDVVLGARVLKIDRVDKKIALEDGRELSYSKLALTTGASVRRIKLPGIHLPGVCYLRDLQDVHEIRKYIGNGRSAVVIGGGYIGLEAAASLRAVGMDVTVLEALPRVLARVTSPEISEFYARVHREEGTRVLTDVSIDRVAGEGSVTGVHLADGSYIPADLVLVGIGVSPATGLAEAAGLDVDNGIVVDEFAQTSDEDIVAAGDCTLHYNPIYETTMRLESVQNANDQAKVAARTICGKYQPYRALPWFWSDQYDVKLQIAGSCAGFDKVLLRGDPESGRSFAAFYFSGDSLLAVDAINQPKAFLLAKRFLSEGKTADPLKVVDETVDLKDVFFDPR